MITARKVRLRDRTKATLHSAEHAVNVFQFRQDALSMAVCGNSGTLKNLL